MCIITKSIDLPVMEGREEGGLKTSFVHLRLGHDFLVFRLGKGLFFQNVLLGEEKKPLALIRGQMTLHCENNWKGRFARITTASLDWQFLAPRMTLRLAFFQVSCLLLSIIHNVFNDVFEEHQF